MTFVSYHSFTSSLSLNSEGKLQRDWHRLSSSPASHWSHMTQAWLARYSTTIEKYFMRFLKLNHPEGKLLQPATFIEDCWRFLALFCWKRRPALIMDITSTKWFALAVVIHVVVTSVCGVSSQNCSTRVDCSSTDDEQCCHGMCTQSTSCPMKTMNNTQVDGVCDNILNIRCNLKCVANWGCLKPNCSVDSDCQGYEICCHGICMENKQCSHFTATVIILSAMLILMVLVFSSACKCLICHRQRYRRRGNPNMSWSILSTTLAISNEIADQSLDSDDYPNRLSPRQTLFVPTNGKQMPRESGNLEEESRGVTKCVISYGSTGMLSMIRSQLAIPSQHPKRVVIKWETVNSRLCKKTIESRLCEKNDIARRLTLFPRWFFERSIRHPKAIVVVQYARAKYIKDVSGNIYFL